MAKQVNMHEAKTHFSRLVEDALTGEDVVIARAGKPVIRLVPYAPVSKPRRPGALKGKITIPDDFDDWTPELEEMFYGGATEPVEAAVPPAKPKRKSKHKRK